MKGKLLVQGKLLGGGDRGWSWEMCRSVSFGEEGKWVSSREKRKSWGYFEKVPWAHGPSDHWVAGTAGRMLREEQKDSTGRGDGDTGRPQDIRGRQRTSSGISRGHVGVSGRPWRSDVEGEQKDSVTDRGAQYEVGTIQTRFWASPRRWHRGSPGETFQRLRWSHQD